MQPVDLVVAAALANDQSTIRRMIAADPDLLNARTMYGVGAIHVAHFGRHPHLVALLTKLGQRSDVVLAAELGYTDQLRERIEADPDLIRHVDPRGATPLHGAVYWGQRDTTELLLAAGADPDAPTRDPFLQITPLGSAIATTPGVPQPSDHEDVVLTLVKLLLGHGADVNASRRDGMTPLHTAAWRGLADVAEELVEAGADPAATATDGPHNGQTPADTALAQGHLALAERLARS